MVSAGKVEVFIDANTDKLNRGLRQAGQNTQRAGDRMRRSFDGIGRAAAIAGTALAAAFSLRGLASIADSVNLLRARISLYTDSVGESERAMQGLFETSRATGVSFDSLAEIYARLAPAQRALNLSSNEMLGLSEAIGASFRISGASAQEASAATIQLSQAFASGQLRGEELRSVMEQGQRIMLALQRATGNTTGELRAMAEAGELTADVVSDALLRELPRLRDELDQLPETVTTGFQKMQTGFTELVASIDEATGSSAAFGEMLANIGDGLSGLASRNTLEGLNQQLTTVEGTIDRILGDGRPQDLSPGMATQFALLTTRAAELRREISDQTMLGEYRDMLESWEVAESQAADAADELNSSLARQRREAVSTAQALSDMLDHLEIVVDVQREQDAAEQAEAALSGASDALDRFTIDAQRAGDMVTGAIGGAFDKMARGVKVTFRDLAQEIMAIFARIAFNNLIAGPVSQFASNLFSGGGGGVGGAIAGALGTTATAAAVAPSAKGGASSQTIINIDAKYASQGTAEMIVAKIQEAAPALIQQSSNVAVQTINQTQRARAAF